MNFNKKTTFKTIIFVSVVFLLSQFVLADGFMKVFDDDVWQYLIEEKQLCAINYYHGIQNMILTIELGTDLEGEKAVWIFPVPAKPEDVSINILDQFPAFRARSLKNQARDSLGDSFMVMRLSQIYTFPSLIFGIRGGMLGKYGLSVHESVESMGLTTELVTAEDSQAIMDYAESKNLILFEDSKEILDDYIGEDYSFVISWISDVEEFKKQNEAPRRGFVQMNIIGVFISFPTEKIYYPLKPTSVYGDKKIPTTIYVLNHVKPELYNEIKNYVEIDYYRSNIEFEESLRDFFVGQKISSHYSYVENVEYTRIDIDAPSKNFKEDLWMEVSVPAKVKLYDFINNQKMLLGILIFIICSMLASLFAGLVLFENEKISKIKFSLLGLGNILSLPGFLILSFIVNKKDKTFFPLKESEEKIPFKKIILITITMSFFLMFSFLFLVGDPIDSWDSLNVPVVLLIFFIIMFGIFSIMWSTYEKKEIFFNALIFSAFFMIITLVFQGIISLLL